MTYPALVLRIRAMCIDLIIFTLLFWGTLVLVWRLELSAIYLKVVVLAVPLLLLEPMLLWLSGSTIGQHIVGIKVANKETGQNLFILKALIRYIVKMVLGFYSIITMAVTKRRQSFHDVVSGSVVLFKNETSAPSRYKIAENRKDGDARPGAGRRLLVIGVYLFLLYLIFGFVSYLLAPDKCWTEGMCTEPQQLRVMLGIIGFICAVLLVVVLGVLCKLPGAYYKKSVKILINTFPLCT
ncbi:MAG: RDD family protein [Pseudomonadota bacterium]